MTDNADNSLENGGTVRVAGWVIEELEATINKLPRKQRPTRGDLLWEAWKVYRAQWGFDENSAPPAPDGFPTPPVVAPDDSKRPATVKTKDQGQAVSREDLRRLRRLAELKSSDSEAEQHLARIVEMALRDRK